jgi:hypothetical protein
METGLKRVGNDCYFTKEHISKSLIEKISLNSFDLIIEPSAGSGSFIKNLKNVKYLAYDIEPKYPEIIKQDYLLLDTSQFTGKILVLGNPPFGKCSSLASKFIKKSCEYADTIAFVLPKSFKKPSKYKAFPLNFHCILIEDLPKNSFTINDKDIDVECSFFIYEKRNYNRNDIPILKSNENYKFIKKEQIELQTNVIAFRRVGVYAGKFIFENTNELSSESHYFIVLNKELNVSNCKFDTNNTVGPKSISKQELIKELNKLN